MSLPTPYVVQRLEWLPDAGRDSHGNRTGAYAQPVDVPVHGWASPADDTEPYDGNRDAVVRDLDLYAPAGTQVGPKDQVIVDGVTYDVVGHVTDFTHGPWQWAAGVRISLKRPEG